MTELMTGNFESYPGTTLGGGKKEAAKAGPEIVLGRERVQVEAYGNGRRRQKPGYCGEEEVALRILQIPSSETLDGP